MRSFATQHDDPSMRLGWSERIGYGLGGCSIHTLFSITGAFIVMYMTNVAMADIAAVSTIIAVSKLLDGISDVVIGNIIDNTVSPMGRARIWMRRMCLPLAVSMMLLFFVPAGWPSALKYVYMFLMYNIASTCCITFLQISQFSLIALTTSNSEEQGLLGVIQSIASGVGVILGNALFVKVLALFSSDPANPNTQRGYTCAILCFVVFMIIGVTVDIMSTKERVSFTREKDQKGNDRGHTKAAVKALISDKYWIIMTVGQILIFAGSGVNSVSCSYYALYVLGDMGSTSWLVASAMLPVTVIQLIAPLLMKKIGKKWTFTLGQGIAAAACMGFGLSAPAVPAMIACNVVRGMGIGLSTASLLGLVADMIAYTSLKTGIFTAGLGNAGVSAASKIGQGLGNSLFGFVMAAAGFNAALDGQGLAQPAPVLSMTAFTYIWVPMICYLIVFLLFSFFFNMDKEMERLKEDI